MTATALAATLSVFIDEVCAFSACESGGEEGGGAFPSGGQVARHIGKNLGIAFITKFALKEEEKNNEIINSLTLTVHNKTTNSTLCIYTVLFGKKCLYL